MWGSHLLKHPGPRILLVCIEKQTPFTTVRSKSDPFSGEEFKIFVCARRTNLTSAHVTERNTYTKQAASPNTNNPSTREKLVCLLFSGIVICLDLEFNQD